MQDSLLSEWNMLQSDCALIRCNDTGTILTPSTVDETQSKTAGRLQRTMRITVITSRLRVSILSSQPKHDWKTDVLSCISGMDSKREHRLSQLWIICVLFSWNHHLYLMCRTGIASSSRLFLLSNLTGPTHLITGCLFRSCLCFLFLLYSKSASAALPQRRFLRRTTAWYSLTCMSFIPMQLRNDETRQGHSYFLFLSYLLF